MIEISHSYALDDSCQIKFYARGHHVEATFREAVAKDVIADRRAIDGAALDRAKVRQTYWRVVPRTGNIVAESEFVESRKGPGAFAITILDEWYPLHAYLPYVRDEA